MKKILSAAAIFSVLAMPAFAADLPNTKGAPMYAPPPPPAFSWTGFYIGGNVGYDWGNDPVTDVDEWDYAPGTVGGRVHPQGVTGGGQIGYNWQFTPFIVTGIEGEGGYISLHGSRDYCLQTGNFCGDQVADGGALPDDYARVSGGAYGAVTGKLGFAVDRALFYAKGGVAFGDFSVAFSTPYVPGGATNNHVNVGWTIGGGVEYALNQNWSIKGEYDFYDFGSTTNSMFDDGTLYHFRYGLTANKAVVGVNYRFDFLAPPGPVVAKY